MDDTEKKDALLGALLPEIPFDGWTTTAMRAAAARAKLEPGELDALFPGGPRDAVAWFSRWADRETLAALKSRRRGRMRTSELVALGVKTRLAILLPHREAVRRALSLLALPQNLALGAKLLYEAVDTIWHGAGDASTDFNFYTKRGLLAGVYASTTLYWLDDRSEGMTASEEFLGRRLADVLAVPRLGDIAARLPNPSALLRVLTRRGA